MVFETNSWVMSGDVLDKYVDHVGIGDGTVVVHIAVVVYVVDVVDKFG